MRTRHEATPNRGVWTKTRMTSWLCAAVAAGQLACAAGSDRLAAVQEPTVVLSIVGTNDLHGGVLPRDDYGGLSLLGGYLKNLRAARAQDGGAVLLIDAGDMFQGTLESNLNEGAAVVQAYNALGYTAVAVGNHEFDFGPAGEAPVPRNPGDDPRGALKTRAAEARFPFLAANVIDEATGKPVAWPNVTPSTIVEAAGMRVGIIGVTTIGTLAATMAANTTGLEVAPLARTVVEHATALRSNGADLVIVTAHAGGRCTEFENPQSLSSCDQGAEIVDLVRELPTGLVDVIVAGHTHAGMAHEIAGLPVVEAYAGGRAFGRVDLTVDRNERRVVALRLFRPQDLCSREDPDSGRCDGGRGSSPAAVTSRYEGAPVAPDGAIDKILMPAVEAARRLKETPLGVQLDSPIRRSQDVESALGNLFADLMREAVGGSDVAITNGGGLRADLSAGPLTYGKLFEAMPFDNRLVRLNLTGRELKRVFTSHFSRGGSIVSVSGVQVRVLCESGALSVSLTRERGRSILDDDPLTVVTSDFLATGGDRLFEPVTPLRVVSSAEGDPVMRDAMAERLRARGGSLREGQLIDPRAPRLAYEGRRPIRCAPRAAESISPFPAPYAGPASAPAPGIFSSAAAPAPGPEGAPEPAPSWAIMQSDVLAG